ncbi:MAG: response regulator transcription factor [Nevskiaceae bacterium]
MDASDRLVRALYALAVEEDWAQFRVLALARVCRELAISEAVWTTQASDQAHPGEFTSWPTGRGSLNTQQMMALPLREQAESAIDGARGGVALRQPHLDSRLSSRFAFWFRNGRPPAEQLRRVIGHLVEAGALALQHFIQSDERLSRWGRSNRGTAAMVDRHGTVYAASPAFRALLGADFGDPEFDRLPFALPEDILEDRGAFGHSTLRFRLVATQRNRYLIYARKVQALDGLSPREQEIARALAAGKTLKSVARQYGIATSTVANHASRIYRKLGIYRREELFELIRSTSGRKSGDGAA